MHISTFASFLGHAFAAPTVHHWLRGGGAGRTTSGECRLLDTAGAAGCSLVRALAAGRQPSRAAGNRAGGLAGQGLSRTAPTRLRPLVNMAGPCTCRGRLLMLDWGMWWPTERLHPTPRHGWFSTLVLGLPRANAVRVKLLQHRDGSLRRIRYVYTIHGVDQQLHARLHRLTSSC